MSRPQRVRRFLGNTVAIVFGLILAVASLELGVRLVADALDLSSYMEYDELLGWVARPSSTKHHKDAVAGFDVTYEINRYGHRGPAYDIDKHPGTHRIVVIGDSNGFGWGIPEGKEFAAILDRDLPDTEVINLSLGGYGTDQEYLRFVREGEQFSPDIVILQLTHNDFEEIEYPFFNQKPKPEFVFDDAGRLELTNVPVRPTGPRAARFYANSIPVPFREWLDWSSYSYNFLNQKYYGLMREYSRRDPQTTSDPADPFGPESFRKFNGIVAKLEEELDRIGAHGIIVHGAGQISEKSYLLDVGLPVIDLYPKLAALDDEQHGSGPWFPDRYHWNVQGHAFVASELSKAIEERGWLR